jgi:hypothetical protein
MKKIYFLILMVCAVLSPWMAIAHNGNHGGDDAEIAMGQSLFDLTYTNDAIEATLKVDMATLISNKKNNEEIAATFSFVDKDGQLREFSTKVRSRGKFRRRVCDLPPLKLNFKKGELTNAGLKDYDKYKLVTHCLDSREGQENLLREFTAYKLYNQLTNNSFRVQLLKINYVDVLTHDETNGYAILIEETDEMADRLNGTVIKDKYGMTQAELEHENSQMHAMFQYMIGNTDWDVARLHNMKVLETGQSTGAIAVPYDFDFSGLVDAGYARPNVNVGQTAVRQRVFMGQDFDVANWASTIEHFKSKRARILMCIRKCSFLKKSAKRDMISYINSFYNHIDQGVQ